MESLSYSFPQGTHFGQRHQRQSIRECFGYGMQLVANVCTHVELE